MTFHAGSFAADYAEMITFLTRCQNHRRTVSSLAAVIFAHESDELTSKSLVLYLDYWHYRSDEFIDFVFPGYVGDPSLDEWRTTSDASFSARAFAGVVARVESESESTWSYSGKPSVLLVTAIRDSLDDSVRLDFDEVIDFDIAEAIGTAMARAAGWGKDFPEMLRNEDWNYAVFHDRQAALHGS